MKICSVGIKFLFCFGALFIVSTHVHSADSSVIVSEAIPFSLIADTAYVIPVTIKNTGDTAWTKAGGYALGSIEPAHNTRWGTNRAELLDTEQIAVGESKTFLVAITTPDTADSYSFRWRMVKGDSGWFGDSTTARFIHIVHVGIPAETISVLDFFISDNLGQGLAGAHAQSETVVGRWAAYVKWDSSAIETFHWDREYLYLKEDHTMGTTAPQYLMEPGRWMKLHMPVGAVIDQSANKVYWYENSYKCTLSGQYAPKNHPYTITLDAHLPAVNFGGDLGVQEVIVIKYNYAYNYERFYYSRQWGWIAWEWYSPTNRVHQQSLFNMTGAAAIAPGPEYTAQTIGVFEPSDSGTLTVSAYFGQQGISIESGTFGESVIVVASVPPTPLLASPGFTGVNAGYTDLGLRITFDTPAAAAKKARIAMTWRDQDVASFNENKFQLGELDTATGNWRGVVTTLDTAANSLSAAITIPGMVQIFEVNSTTADATWYVSADTGADTAAGSSAAPFRTIRKALAAASYGETVMVWSGVYAETVVFVRDGVSIVGVDSSLTVIDCGDSAAGASFTGIAATALTRLMIRDLQVRNAYRGILLTNADSCLVERVLVRNVGSRGVELAAGSSGNTLRAVSVTRAGDNGILLDSSDSNEITGCAATSNGAGGVALIASDSNIVSRNTSSMNAYIGISVGSGSDSNIVVSNTVCTNASVGIHVSASAANTVETNLLYRNARNIGCTFARANIARNNLARESTDNGIIVEGGSSYNLFESNLVVASTWSGIGILSSDSNSFIGNTLSSNGANGFYLLNNSSANLLSRNQVLGNADYGMRMDNSNANVAVLNVIDSNSNYAVCLTGSSSSDTISRNNIGVNPAHPDRGILNATPNAIHAARNWWGTADSASIAAKLSNTGGGAISFLGYRLEPIDTTAGADSIAPAAPAITISDTTYAAVRIHFSLAATNEDSIPGEPGVVAYRLYRSSESTPSNWGVWIASGNGSPLVDTQACAGSIYRYTVTAVDGASRANESFFSSAIAGGPTTRNSGDFSGDGSVSSADVMLMMPRYRVPSSYSAMYDVGKGGADGIIDFEDVAELGRRFGN